MKRKPIAIVVFAACLLAAMPAAASPLLEKERTAAVTLVNERVSLEVYGGYLRGESHEFVYDASTGKKLSELIWKFDDAAVVGGTLGLRPAEWLTLRLDGWIPLRTRNRMDDYDWIKDDQSDWSHWSVHSDTKMHRAQQLDAGIALRTLHFEGAGPIDRGQLDLLAGYRWLYLSWTSYGGSYIYSSAEGFRDRTGTFPEGQAGISYEQWFETPYLGVGGSVSLDRWTFSGAVTGSLWGRARARDNHHMRDLVFEDRCRSMPMLAGEVAFSHALTSHLTLTGGARYVKHFETRGTTDETDYSTGAVTHYPGEASGMNHEALMVNLGLRLAF